MTAQPVSATASIAGADGAGTTTRVRPPTFTITITITITPFIFILRPSLTLSRPATHAERKRSNVNLQRQDVHSAQSTAQNVTSRPLPRRGSLADQLGQSPFLTFTKVACRGLTLWQLQVHRTAGGEATRSRGSSWHECNQVDVAYLAREPARTHPLARHGEPWEFA